MASELAICMGSNMYQVLLADDELIFLEFLKNVITWEHYDCEICACMEDGVSVYQYIMEKQPDIAFIDISMPQKTGLEICELLRMHNVTIKLVIITGHDEFSFAYQSIKLGIDDYLLKPFSKEELEAAVLKITKDLKNEREVNDKRLGSTENELGDIRESATKYEILTKELDRYLLRNYAGNNLSLDIIAQDFGFESSYLRRIFKWNTGVTIMQRLENIRIDKAKFLLRSGQYRNKDIAVMVGFSDQYYFSKRFKQLCGKTPTEYRDNSGF